MKTTSSRFKVFFLFLWFIMSCLPISTQAADKVVVIPLFGHGKPLKNIVTVVKANGKFTDPVAAVNSITDASENNPYLVVIGPGVYTLTHTPVMKPWVDITGSGENVTRLVGAIYNYGIYNLGSSPMMMYVSAEGRAGSHAYGIYNNGSSPIISQVSATASGGNDC